MQDHFILKRQLNFNQKAIKVNSSQTRFIALHNEVKFSYNSPTKA